MSSQLMPAYYTTLNTKKSKAKKLDVEKMKAEMKKYNKDMRRIRAFSAQFETVEEYINYKLGKPRKKHVFKELDVKKQDAPRHRESEDVKHGVSTSDKVAGSCPKREPRQYTGNYIVGIATMHKSNLVPVGRNTDTKDFATMRRG